MSKKRSFATRFKLSNQPFCGIWLVLNSPTAAEIVKNSGADWVIVDMQHGVSSLETTQTILQVIGQESNVGTFVRIPYVDQGIIRRILDMGADGIVVPDVISAKQVSEVVKFAKYPPLGDRSVSTSMTRATKYGLEKSYIEKANSDVFIIIQIETLQAAEEIDEIVEIEGVSAIFPGPKDLAGSMGLFGDINNDEVKSKISKIERKTLDKGLILAGANQTPGDEKELSSRGYGLITIGSEATLLAKTTSEFVKHFNANATNGKSK